MNSTHLPLFDSHGAAPALPVCEHIAGSVKFAEKALEIQEELAAGKDRAPFDITLDMEDGAAVGQEAGLLESFLSLLNSPKNKRKQLGIRIHDMQSEFWMKDLDAIAKHAGKILAYIKIPKIQHPNELKQVRELLSGKIPLHAIVESITAFPHLDEIARDPWVSVLDFGLMDFTSDHGGLIPESCMQSPGQFDHELIRRAKVDLVMACVRNRKTASHNPTVLVKDAEATRNDAAVARYKFGFSRMWSVHPVQINAIIEGMSPSKDELEKARAIISAAQKANFGPIFFEGRLHDRASFRYYADLIRRSS